MFSEFLEIEFICTFYYKKQDMFVIKFRKKVTEDQMFNKLSRKLGSDAEQLKFLSCCQLHCRDDEKLLPFLRKNHGKYAFERFY